MPAKNATMPSVSLLPAREHDHAQRGKQHRPTRTSSNENPFVKAFAAKKFIPWQYLKYQRNVRTHCKQAYIKHGR